MTALRKPHHYTYRANARKEKKEQLHNTHLTHNRYIYVKCPVLHINSSVELYKLNESAPRL